MLAKERCDDLPSAILFRDALALCSIKMAAPIRQKLVRALGQWQGQAALQRLTEAAQGFMSNPAPSLTSGLVSALRSAADSTPADEANAVAAALQASFHGAASCSDPRDLSGVCALWEALVQKPSVMSGLSDGEQVISTCQVLLDATQPFLSLSNALKAFGEASAQEGGDMLKVMGPSIADLKKAFLLFQGLCDAHEDLEKHAPPKCPEESWVALWALLATFAAQLEEESLHCMLKTTRLHKERVSVAVHFLAQVAGGASGGRHWHSNIPDGSTNLMLHFGQTLELLDVQRVTSLTTALKQARLVTSPMSSTELVDLRPPPPAPGLSM